MAPSPPPTPAPSHAGATGSRRFAAMNAETLAASHEIVSHEDAVFVLRSREFSMNITPGLGSEFGAHVLADTLAEIDGQAHRDRRRALGRLFRPDMALHYEQARLQPAVDALVARLPERRGPDGVVRGDLRQIAREMLVSTMAEVVGFDDVYPDGVSDFMALFGILDDGARVKWTTRDPAEVMRAALDARRRIIDRYFRPSWRRRQALVNRAQRDQLGAAQLPRDLITTMIRHRDHYAQWDDELVEREALLFVVGSIGTTSNAITWTAWEIDRWLIEHPEDADRRTEARFLGKCVNEALRLHPENPFIPRRADRDVTLPSGIHVAAGDLVLVLSEASLDGSGDAPAAFDPHRGIPLGALPFGFAFGGGRHTCIGKGLVLGDQSNEVAECLGTVRTVLRSLYGAGMRIDPSLPATPENDTVRAAWKTMPVVFDAV